jgi:hypothetical protein
MEITVHIHEQNSGHHRSGRRSVSKKDLHEALRPLLARLNAMATTLNDVLVLVQENTTLVESLNALIDGIRVQLQEVLEGTVIPPAVQAQIDAVFATASAQKEKITETIVENTLAADIPVDEEPIDPVNPVNPINR